MASRKTQSLVANEKLLRDRIRHSVDLQRYGNATVRDILGLLNEADRDLTDQLRRRLDAGRSNWTTRRLQVMLEDLGRINAENYTRAQEVLKGEMEDFATHETEQVSAQLRNSIPIEFAITTPTAPQLAAMVSTEPITVGPEGKLLLEEIFQGLAAGKERTIRQAVRLGMSEGETSDQIVRRLIGTRSARYTDGLLEYNRRGAEAMVRTVVNHVSNRAADMTYKENGDLVKNVQWTSTLDSRTTPICQARDGKLFPVDSGPRPPAHVGCRSFVVPVLKSWRELGIPIDEMDPGTRASMDGQVPAKLTYPEWLREHPERAVDALGVTRAKLFLEGKMPIDKFVNDKGRTLTLKELREKQAKYFTSAGI